VVVGEREVDEAEEGPEKQPDAEKPKPEVAEGGVCHGGERGVWRRKAARAPAKIAARVRA
jgi:hypothetical protein